MAVAAESVPTAEVRDRLVLAGPDAGSRDVFLPANCGVAFRLPHIHNATVATPHSWQDALALAWAGRDVSTHLLDRLPVEANHSADITEPVMASHRRAVAPAQRWSE